MVDLRKQWKRKPADVQNTWAKFGLAPKRKGEAMTKRIRSISGQVQNRSIITGMNANGPMVESKKHEMQLTTNAPTHTSSKITGDKNATTKRQIKKAYPENRNKQLHQRQQGSCQGTEGFSTGSITQKASIRIIMTAVFTTSD